MHKNSDGICSNPLESISYACCMEPNRPPTRIVLRPANNDVAWKALWEWLLAPSSRDAVSCSQNTVESAPPDDDEATDDDI